MSPPYSVPVEAKPAEQHISLNGDIYTLPTFTMKQIHDAIPAHCFQPSILRSMAYVARDYFYLGTLIYLSTTYIPLLPSPYLRFFAWTSYTIIAGMVMTGIWILAHECGHGGFSKNKQLNNIMGLIMHSFLLVPFHSWKITHSAHHKATGNIEKDTVFVPHTRESWVKANFGKDADASSVELAHLAEDAPLVTLWYAFVHQVFGWPGYLLFNLTGQDYEGIGFPQYSHFYFGRDSPFFKAGQLRLIMLSDVGVGIMMVLLGLCVCQFGWWNVAVLYGVPYLWVNHWIGEFVFFPRHLDVQGLVEPSLGLGSQGLGPVTRLDQVSLHMIAAPFNPSAAYRGSHLVPLINSIHTL
jgi:omega-6 fatty acid desaturase / acyl-lipid omega-6 desaturase (Delta-12 desaturase)